MESTGWDIRFNEIREIRKGKSICIYVSHQNMLIQNDINDKNRKDEPSLVGERSVF